MTDRNYETLKKIFQRAGGSVEFVALTPEVRERTMDNFLSFVDKYGDQVTYKRLLGKPRIRVYQETQAETKEQELREFYTQKIHRPHLVFQPCFGTYLVHMNNLINDSLHVNPRWAALVTRDEKGEGTGIYVFKYGFTGATSFVELLESFRERS